MEERKKDILIDALVRRIAALEGEKAMLEFEIERILKEKEKKQ